MSNPSPAPLPPGGGPNRRPPLRGHKRLALIRDIAAGDLTGEQLAEKHDRYPTQISDFRNRPDVIEAVAKIRANKGDALAALWASEKANRVAELQDSVERLSRELQDGERADPGRERARQAGLRAIAEELGQLTTKVEGRSIIYRVEAEGIDMNDLT